MWPRKTEKENKKKEGSNQSFKDRIGSLTLREGLFNNRKSLPETRPRTGSEASTLNKRLTLSPDKAASIAIIPTSSTTLPLQKKKQSEIKLLDKSFEKFDSLPLSKKKQPETASPDKLLEGQVAESLAIMSRYPFSSLWWCFTPESYVAVVDVLQFKGKAKDAFQNFLSLDTQHPFVQSYLKMTARPTIRHLVNSLYELMNTKNFELDHQNKKHAKNINSALEIFVDSFSPDNLRGSFKYSLASYSHMFKESFLFQNMAKLIIHHLTLPALKDPTLFLTAAKPISSQYMKNVEVFSKVLEQLGTGELFPESNLDYAIVNEFLRTHKQIFHLYMKISNLDLDASQNETSEDLSCLEHALTLRELIMKNHSELMSRAQDHMTEIDLICFTHYLNHLRTPQPIQKFIEKNPESLGNSLKLYKLGNSLGEILLQEETFKVKVIIEGKLETFEFQTKASLKDLHKPICDFFHTVQSIAVAAIPDQESITRKILQNMKKSIKPLPPFGTSLSDLMRVQEQRYPDLQLTIPWFVHDLMNQVLKHGVSTEGVFRLSGDSKRISQLKEKIVLDERADFSKDPDIHVFTGLLKLWFRELPQPAIPPLLSEPLLQYENSIPPKEFVEQLHGLLAQLDVYHFELLNRLLNLLYQIQLNEKYTKMSGYNLGVVFGPNLLELGKDRGLEQLGITGHAIEFLISYYPEIFHPWHQKQLNDPNCFLLLKRKLRAHDRSIRSIARVVADEKIYLATASVNTVKLRNATTLSADEKPDIDTVSHVFCVLFVDSHLWIATEKDIQIWTVDGKPAKLHQFDDGATSLSQAGSSVWASSVSQHCICIYDIPSKTLQKQLELDKRQKQGFSISTVGNRVWVATFANQLLVYDVCTQELLTTITDHRARINKVIEVGQAAWIAADDAIGIYDNQTLKLIRRIDAQQFKMKDAVVYCHHVYFVAWDATITIFDKRDGHVVHRVYDTHKDCLSGILHLSSPDSDSLWISSFDGFISQWDLKKHHPSENSPLFQK